MAALVPSCPHSSNLRLPSRDTLIHKDECTQCYSDDTAATGLNVCLTCWSGGCTGANQHSQRHYQITRHPLVLNIIRTEEEQPQPAALSSSSSSSSSATSKPDTEAGEEPPSKITKLGINVPGGLQLDSVRSLYKTRVLCLTCNVILQTEDDAVREEELRQAEDSRQRGDAVAAQAATQRPQSELDNVVRAVLLSTSASAPSAGDSSWAGETPTPCEHTLTLTQSSSPPLIGSKGRATCSQCSLTSNLWLCMTCGALGCGRGYADGSGGNGHAVQHWKDSQHPVVVKLGTISAEGTADVFCYACDNTVIDNDLALHLSAFGIDLASTAVTEKSTAQLELDANLQHNWSVVLNEGGSEAVLRYGERMAGFRNVGNSCYLASVVQVLFHLPSFERRYWQEGARHTQDCRNGRPADCFHCQMHKVADGIYSGKYAVVPSEAQLEEARRDREERDREKERAKAGTAMDVDSSAVQPNKSRRKKQLQPGIPPRMFKRLIAKGHPEFSGGKQQDALEFWHYFLSQIQQKEHASHVDPTACFSFRQQDRLECGECHGVRYSTVTSSEISVPIPLPDPLPDQPNASAAPKGKAERQYPPIPFESCLRAWKAKTAIEGYHCPRCRRATTAFSSPSFLTFPEHLLVVVRRFLFDSWVPSKLDAPVRLQPSVDLEELRGQQGPQPGEEELPADSGAPGAASAAPVPNAGIVEQLEGMGFSRNAASRAALAVHNSDGEAAMNWLLQHMEDADINDPLPAPAAASASSSSAALPPAELISQLSSMGFDTARCIYALQQTNNSPDRAVEWLFSHADEPLPSSTAPTHSAAASSALMDGGSSGGSSQYRLYATITHLGKSTSTGHYVCHLRGDDGSWVLFNDEKVSEVEPEEQGGVGKGMDRAYMIVLQRIDRH